MTDPRTMTPVELAAAQLRPLELVHRPDLIDHAPHNLFRGLGGPDVAGVVDAVVDTLAPIPGAVVDPGQTVEDLANVVPNVGSSIAGAVLGPISELVVQAVMTTIAGALLVWAVIALARRSETAQYVNDQGAAIAGAVITKGK